MSLISNQNSGYLQSYKDTLTHFYEDCADLKETPIRYRYSEKTVKALKNPHSPLLTTSHVAQFDYAIENSLKTVDKIDLTPLSGQKADPLTFLSILQGVLHKLEREIILDIRETQEKGLGDKLERWFDKKISKIEIPKNDGTPKNVIDLVKKFLVNCSLEWAAKHNIKKFTLDNDLKNCMSKTCAKMTVTVPDCQVFSMCYLKIQDILIDTYLCNKPLLSDKNFRLVKTPARNDLIIYLDRNNEPKHFGVMLKKHRVISKIGELNCYIHDIKDSRYGNSYIFVRNLKLTLSKKYSPKNVEKMKVDYKPMSKAVQVAYFSAIVDTESEINEVIESMIEGDSFNASEITKKAKEIVRRILKDFMVPYKNKYKFPDHGLQEWIEGQIDNIKAPGNGESKQDIIKLVNNFWRDNIEQWAKKHDVRRFVPDNNLIEFTNNLSNFKNDKYPDCYTFAQCYLMSKIGMGKGFRLVSSPQANDLIAYIDSNNKEVHFSVFKDTEYVISKFGSLGTFEHHYKNCHYGNYYIFLSPIMS